MMRAPHVSIVRKNPISKCGENTINYVAGARWYDMRRNIVHLKIFKSVISKAVARAIIIYIEVEFNYLKSVVTK
jgi:hypothetical protein